MTTPGRDFGLIFERELDRLANEIAAYESDDDLWTTMGAQKNAAGTLAIHTAGALLHFIGAGLGDTGYVRDRDREFAERDLSRDEVVQRIRSCRDVVVPILAGLEGEALATVYDGPMPERLRGMTLRAFTFPERPR